MTGRRTTGDSDSHKRTNRGVRQANDSYKRRVVIRDYKKYKHLGQALRLNGVTRRTHDRWLREEAEYRDAFEAAKDYLAFTFREEHRLAAEQETKLTNFYELERKALEPELYSAEGIATRARQNLEGSSETEFDALG